MAMPALASDCSEAFSSYTKWLNKATNADTNIDTTLYLTNASRYLIFYSDCRGEERAKDILSKLKTLSNSKSNCASITQESSQSFGTGY